MTDFTTSRTRAYRIGQALADRAQVPVSIWLRRDISTGLVIDYAITGPNVLPIQAAAGPSIKASQIATLSPTKG